MKDAQGCVIDRKRIESDPAELRVEPFSSLGAGPSDVDTVAGPSGGGNPSLHSSPSLIWRRKPSVTDLRATSLLDEALGAAPGLAAKTGAHCQIRGSVNKRAGNWNVTSPSHRPGDDPFPAVDNVASIDVTDVLGRGTTCLLWSSLLPGDQRRHLRYIGLMCEKKPHLLERVVNHAGGEIRSACERGRLKKTTIDFLRL